MTPLGAAIAGVAALVALGLLLSLTQWLEARLLSPQQLMAGVVRAPGEPDYAEQVVASQAGRLLAQRGD